VRTGQCGSTNDDRKYQEVCVTKTTKRNREKEQTGNVGETVVDQPEDTGAANTAETPAVADAPDAPDELETLRAERDDYLDQLQRSRAEFLNFKRRNDQERFLLRELVSRDVLSQFLPVIDDVERAIDSLPETERTSSWVAGMELIQSKFLGILERSGVQKINPLNEPFDPKEHEAVASDPGSSGAVVVEVYQPGYKIGETLIRPAMVKTGDAVAEETSKAGQPSFNA
jgi:molecular chaperone GrpE